MIKIESDGTSPGTKVYDEDGKEIVGASKIIWRIKAGDLGQAWIFFPFVEVRVIGEKWVRYEQLRGPAQ